LPDDPEEEPATEDAEPGNDGKLTSSLATTASPPPAPTSTAEKAFDLFDSGKLSERALLATLGVSREGYVPNEVLTLRALAALEAGRLSEDALMKVLG